MKSYSSYSTHQQRGAVLIVGLIMLGVMTLFVISMLKTSIIELKIGGASQVVALNFANAEVAINGYINANNLRFAPSFLGSGSESGWPGSTKVSGAWKGSAYGGDVAVTPIQISCGAWSAIGNMMGAGGLQAVQFDLRATATGTLGGITSMHQGVQSLAAPGSC